MSVSVNYAAQVTTVETLPGNSGSAPDATRKVTHTEYNEAATLNSGTTPPVTLHAAFLATLSSGLLTIDLRTLTGTNAAVVDGNGLKVQIVRVKNLGANDLTIKKGASTGHNLFTATTGQVVAPGAVLMIVTNDNYDDIDATHKFWDLTGTSAQTSEWTIEMG